MKTLLAMGLMTGLAVAAAQPAQAASLNICASPTCGAESGYTIFFESLFQQGFYLNGSLLGGLAVGAENPQFGSFVDGAAKNTFSGSWIDDGESLPLSQTVFFTDPSGGISDVLSYSYSGSGDLGSLTGFLITGMLSATDLAGLGITPSLTAPERTLFDFSYGESILATIQTGVPEPSTWAMLLIGFVGLGYAGFRRSARVRPALA